MSPAGTSVVNPLFGLLWTPELGPLRVPVFFGAAVPIGIGGGENPSESGAAAARAHALSARAGLDNALFGVNFTTLLAGAGLAWVDRGFTLQGEITFAQLLRRSFDADPSRVNFTAGFHAGYAPVDALTLSAEIRVQAWITNPSFLVSDPSRREQASLALGARSKLPLGSVTLRPGICWVQALDAPMTTVDYRIVVIDLPFVF